MNELLNNRIEKIYLSKDRELLMFVTSQEKRIIYDAWGDCCSKSWFESFDNIEAIKGGYVVKIEEMEMEEAKNNEEDDVLKVGLIKITTDKGMCTIDFRNSSNGYYSGVTRYIDLNIVANCHILAKYEEKDFIEL